jgi:putative protease
MKSEIQVMKMKSWYDCTAMKILTATCESMQQIKAYTEAGADEIILALKDGCFSSLHGFSAAEIRTISAANPVRTAVLMNRLFGEEEEQWAENILAEILPYADAILFSDPGLMLTAQRLHAQDHMIYRPETLLTDTGDASWWMEQGLQSVQISPLLTEEEILEIARNVPQTSLQIHGRLLMSVSKRKLLQAYADIHELPSFRDQKDLFLKEESRDGRMPIYENAYGTLIYTDYVQESFSCMNDFMEAGICRYEVDTNGLQEKEAADAIKIYRRQLNGQKEDGSFYMDQYQYLPLSSGYYRQKTVK